ncbi:MAG: MBL fold metallo-hydrolase [Bacteroidota bacterium]
MKNPSQTSVSLQFLGAAGTVTGSKHLLKTPDMNILVDCGLFQGLKALREKNWQPFPFPPENIDVILLTHAHLDHTGYLPALIRNGFKGKIIMTPPTKSIAELILLDSAKLQEEDAEFANKRGFSKHHPALPLYTEDDVLKTLQMFTTLFEDEWHTLSDNIKFRFQRNGHILGASFIEMDCFGKRIVFSGDIGREHSPTLPPPDKPLKADFLVMESTYGNRLHPTMPATEQLAPIVNEALSSGGSILIPSFAIGRAQDLMALLTELEVTHRIPEVAVYLDTPMGRDATEIFYRNPHWHILDKGHISEISKNVRLVQKMKETTEVIRDRTPKIVIAASGMLTGGRVLHYLAHFLKDTRNTILMSGFQAAGTRGRALLEGAQEVKMYGQYHRVRCRIRELTTLSGHADQGELIRWAGDIKNTPEKVFLVHGEPDALDTFRVRLHDAYGWNVIVPELGQEEVLF